MVFNEKKKKQQRQGSPNWWWLDGSSNNAAAGRSPWLRSTLSELEEKTSAMLKLIEADADSFAQRAEMYYRKRPDLVGVVQEFYRMHRSLAEQFDKLKSDSETRRLLMTLRSPFSCDERVPFRKSPSLSPDAAYKNYDAYSDISDDHEGSPVSEVDDPEEDNGTEMTMPREESGGKPPRADGSDEIRKLTEEVERLKEENNTLRDQMARVDATRSTEQAPRPGMYELTKLEEENKKEAGRPLSAASADTPKGEELEEEDPIPKILAQPEIGKSSNTFEPGKIRGGNFLWRLFPKTSKKSSFAAALTLCIFH
ncbi:hypothetical protein MLD38_026400 [Melastoma candidum]|uniref:Uncharacterized protein n=1 Tax=Melastoma candidum TaxID=119954 RepID=A0ACB9NYZ2_9MYRT|nr:hypothetical protein MLD38_026400 [Melastoma candidum]